MTRSPSRFLDLRALSALANMRFATRHRIDGTYSGRHESRQQGGAGEFADYREYAAGEDLRRLDWKVLARTGRSYVRLYQEETNLRCLLALDVSRSMLFGGSSTGFQPVRLAHRQDAYATAGSKLEYAQYLSTALSQVISQGRDQVGLAVLADRLLDLLPPGSTSSHVASIQAQIEALLSRPTLKLASALEELFQRLEQRGVLLLISDFLLDDLDRTFAVLRLFRHRRWEVILLHLVHTAEERLPEGTAFRFEGLENEGRVDCSPGEIRAQYEELFRQHLVAVRTLALSCGCDYRRVSTATPYLQTLGSFLVERTG
jgi:uncharacterized protein (DUF58 family)